MEHANGLEGWDSGFVTGVAVHAAVELAFDYRGDITLTLDGGTDVVGYLFNRDPGSPEPFVDVFEREGGRRRLPYASIRRIRFTGRNTAAGNSYAAWLRSRDAAKVAEPTRSA